jgi:hypothetical protein
MSRPNFEHLAAALPLPDPAFDAFWEHYLRARPDLVDGATLELEREQLRMLQKVAFLAGREAALRETNLLNPS